jgi:hypothetical protein
MNLTPAPDRWEQGSEFHWIRPAAAGSGRWPEPATYWGSGRDAFRALLAHGQRSRGWRRLWIPAYFCQEVAEALRSPGIALKAYPDGPQFAEPSLGGLAFHPGDVILRVNFFGLRVLPPAAALRSDRVEIIDDHTHDPLSRSALWSDADWCVASLRKTLPVPDGAILWSPAGCAPPAVPGLTDERRLASLEKLAAMLLKARYLDGEPVDKPVFRRLALSGEAHIAEGEPSGAPDWTRTLLSTFPVEEWRAARRSNVESLAEALEGLPWLDVLRPYHRDACPFSAVLLFDSAGRRSSVREQLVASNVYPAVLWPLHPAAVDGIGGEFIDFSERMLSVHCDMRYGRTDMQRVAALIRTFGGGYAG